MLSFWNALGKSKTSSLFLNFFSSASRLSLSSANTSMRVSCSLFNSSSFFSASMSWWRKKIRNMQQSLNEHKSFAGSINSSSIIFNVVKVGPIESTSFFHSFKPWSRHEMCKWHNPEESRNTINGKLALHGDRLQITLFPVTYVKWLKKMQVQQYSSLGMEAEISNWVKFNLVVDSDVYSSSMNLVYTLVLLNFDTNWMV